MKRMALCLEYDGSEFQGWQRQRNARSVQASLEEALSRVAAHSITTICAGRTDKGVHALGQVVHFDTTALRSNQSWIFGTNSYLPPSLRVLWVKEVSQDFNARRGALKRHYRYLIYNHRIRPSLERSRVGWFYKTLDVQKMKEAAQYWLGEHDFTSFRAKDCQSKSPVRRIHRIHIERLQGDLISLEIIGNAFLYHMVRNMVGVLVCIGSGEKEPLWAKTVLEARDRQEADITAPASGLYLVSVEYPQNFDLKED